MSNNTKKIDILSKVDFQIFDSIQEPLSIYKLIYDENGNITDLRILYINSESELNYIQKRNVTGKKISELYDRSTVDYYIKIANDIISTGKSKRYETYFAPLDKYYLILSFVYHDLYISLSVDISKHKRHEKNLKESENKYQALFKNNYAPMLLINPETSDIIDANPAACSFYGYKKEELLKMKITDLNILTDEQIFKEMQRARQMKKNHFVFKHRLASGEIRDVDTYSGPITVGGKKLLYSIVHDITQQKRAEKDLRHERELLQAIVNTIPVMITIYDSQVEHMQVNKAFEEITGWSNEEIQHLDVMKAVYPDPAYRLEAAEFMRSLSGWKDLTMTVKDGSKIASSWANVLIPDGRQVGIGIDIRERKKLEEKLKQSRDHLEEQVEARTAELEEAYESLKESESKAKEQAELLNITHEAIIVRDMEDKITFWNNGAEELYGWSKRETQGKILQELLQTEYPEDLEKIKNETLIKDRWEGELTHIKHDKTKINVLSRWSVQKDDLNNPVGFMIVNSDITERKNAEKSLKENEEKYRELVENANSIIIRLDRKGNITFFNEFAEEFFGFRKEEVKGKNIVGTIVPKSESYGRDLQELMNRVIKDPENYGYVENENITKHGKIVWVSWTNKGIFNKKGELKGLLSIGTDITERKKAEKNLEEQAELLNLTHEAIIVRDMEDKIAFWNDGAVEMYGWDKDEASGKIIHNLLQTVFPQPLEEIETHILNKNQWNGELIHKTRDGSQIVVSSRWTLKRDEEGTPVSILEINSNITNRKKAEENLKRSETILQEATRLSKVGAYEWDIKKDKFIFSREWRRIHGVREKYLSSEELMNVAHPEDIPKVNKALYNALKGTKQYDIEHRIINQLNGEVRYIHAMGTVLKDETDHPIKMYGVADDITESKLAEMERENLIKDLRQTNEELRQFAYITSHDLQEPLRTMSSYAGLLKHRYEGQLDQDADDFIEFMVSGAARMKSMIQGLLDYSRIGTRGEQFKNFNSEVAVNYALSDLKPFIKENNAEITYDKLPVIYADKDQIARVFQNLIENAIKFRRKDETPQIHISAQKKDDEYVFSVSDNSIGMEPEYTDKIFEIFKRLHAIGEYKGAGIGLAIVKRIIDRHGGRVWVRSELDKGSTFYFTIPVNFNPQN
ncbi:PAS domain-containing sensor histidine kinase [Methanobacterium sp.]|uniref:PAS domain-containing sensor histidine kinase n=1 Tax=Methanobacterium sp. TaxID=2164 RepID=UPI003C77C09D